MGKEQNITGGESINALIEVSQTYLNRARAHFVAHMNDLHGGSPASACHTCKGWIGLIQTEERSLAELRKKL